MAEKKTPETKPFKVKSAFVWDKKIRKPSDKEALMLTTAEAAPLLHRGKIELGKPGIFDEPYLNTQIGEFELDASQPRLTCKAADVPDLQAKDEVQIGGQVYYLLTGPQFDGTGMAVLSLAKA